MKKSSVWTTEGGGSGVGRADSASAGEPGIDVAILVRETGIADEAIATLVAPADPVDQLQPGDLELRSSESVGSGLDEGDDVAESLESTSGELFALVRAFEPSPEAVGIEGDAVFELASERFEGHGRKVGGGHGLSG